MSIEANIRTAEKYFILFLLRLSLKSFLRLS